MSYNNLPKEVISKTLKLKRKTDNLERYLSQPISYNMVKKILDIPEHYIRNNSWSRYTPYYDTNGRLIVVGKNGGLFSLRENGTRVNKPTVGYYQTFRGSGVLQDIKKHTPLPVALRGKNGLGRPVYGMRDNMKGLIANRAAFRRFSPDQDKNLIVQEINRTLKKVRPGFEKFSRPRRDPDPVIRVSSEHQMLNKAIQNALNNNNSKRYLNGYLKALYDAGYDPFSLITQLRRLKRTYEKQSYDLLGEQRNRVNQKRNLINTIQKNMAKRRMGEEFNENNNLSKDEAISFAENGMLNYNAYAKQLGMNEDVLRELMEHKLKSSKRRMPKTPYNKINPWPKKKE